jgi:hypothetical protein
MRENSQLAVRSRATLAEVHSHTVFNGCVFPISLGPRSEVPPRRQTRKTESKGVIPVDQVPPVGSAETEQRAGDNSAEPVTGPVRGTTRTVTCTSTYLTSGTYADPNQPPHADSRKNPTVGGESPQQHAPHEVPTDRLAPVTPGRVLPYNPNVEAVTTAVIVPAAVVQGDQVGGVQQ